MVAHQRYAISAAGADAGLALQRHGLPEFYARRLSRFFADRGFFGGGLNQRLWRGDRALSALAAKTGKAGIAAHSRAQRAWILQVDQQTFAASIAACAAGDCAIDRRRSVAAEGQ